MTVEMSPRIGPHCGEYGWGIPASPRPILRARRVNSRAVGPAVLVRHVAQLVRGRSGQAEPRSSSGRRRRAVALPWDASPFYNPLGAPGILLEGFAPIEGARLLCTVSVLAGMLTPGAGLGVPLHNHGAETTAGSLVTMSLLSRVWRCALRWWQAAMVKLVSPDRILYVVKTEADLQKLVTAKIVPNYVVAANLRQLLGWTPVGNSTGDKNDRTTRRETGNWQRLEDVRWMLRAAGPELVPVVGKNDWIFRSVVEPHLRMMFTQPSMKDLLNGKRKHVGKTRTSGCW